MILLNVDEMTTDHAKFGNGRQGRRAGGGAAIDDEQAGGRRDAFDGMMPPTPPLGHRATIASVDRFREITQNQFDSRRGFYGAIGDQCVIKNSRILKDVKVGAHAYIKGANKLKNLTINSSPEEPTQIGEGVELVNGIVGLGCNVFYGCKAVRFVLGNNSKLKYGARLIHSFLGDNSTVSSRSQQSRLPLPRTAPQQLVPHGSLVMGRATSPPG